MDRLRPTERQEAEAIFCADFARLTRLLVGSDPYATSLRIRAVCAIVEETDTVDLIGLAEVVKGPRRAEEGCGDPSATFPMMRRF